MKFCDACGNVLVFLLSEDDDDERATETGGNVGSSAPASKGGSATGDPNKNCPLVHHCRHCNRSEVIGCDVEVCVHSEVKVDDRALVAQICMDDAEHDPTLPRAENVRCPSCRIEPPQAAPVLYASYHPTELRFVYKCTGCKHVWHT